MTTPLVSIIVPIYKVEPYLRRCINSIIKQTYTNLEIILVDDGSPDACPQICDEYAAKDNRIIVIHKKNGGLSDARNAGLDTCKGEYISFVDSDDWIADTFVEVMIHTINQREADISVVNFIRVSNSHITKKTAESKANIEELKALQSVKKLWSNNYVTFVIACGKLYKAELFKSIRFPKGKLYEDEYTTYKLLYRAKKTVFLNTPLYFYFQRSDSIMGEAPKSSLRLLDAMIERYAFFKKNNEQEIVGLCLKDLCWDLLFAYSQSHNHKLVINNLTTEELLKEYRQAVIEYANTRSAKHLIFLKLFALFPFLYSFYQKISPYKIRKT